MDAKQHIQENQYRFPYHHLVSFDDTHFTQIRQLRWGYIYASYLTEIIRTIENRKPCTILDVGCGDGKLLKEISEKIPHVKVEGVDYSEQAVALARAFNPAITLHVGDITDPRMCPGPYECITLIETLEHIPPNEIPSFLSSLQNRLMKSGFLLITVPSTNTPLEPKHYQHFSKESLTATLSPYFQVESIRFLNAPGWGEKIIRYLLSNRICSITSTRITSFLFSAYTRRYLHSTPLKGRRMLALCTPAT